MSDTHLDETRLHDAADGSLADADAGAVESHLASCAACAERVRSIRALLEEARGLAGPVEPERDLWPGIASRLGSRGENEIAFPARVRVDRETAPSRRTTWPPWLRVAAAVALLAVGGAGGILIARAGQAPPAPVASAPGEGAGPGEEAALDQGAALASDVMDVRGTVAGEYANPVAELEAELERRRDQLPPETVVEIERNLEIVDRAIEAAMAAFDESPGDPVLPDMLHSAYGRKVKLLERAVGLPRAI